MDRDHKRFYVHPMSYQEGHSVLRAFAVVRIDTKPQYIRNTLEHQHGLLDVRVGPRILMTKRVPELDPESIFMVKL